jgi:hypothetical protein
MKSTTSDHTVMEDSTADNAAIIRVLNNYFKAINEGDVTLLASTFYPGTLLFGDVKGQPYAKTLQAYVDGVRNRTSPRDSGKPFKGTITSIDVINSIAVAKLNVRMFEFNYHEFLSLHKISGSWFIVNKMLTDVVE